MKQYKRAWNRHLSRLLGDVRRWEKDALPFIEAARNLKDALKHREVDPWAIVAYETLFDMRSVVRLIGAQYKVSVEIKNKYWYIQV